MKRVLIVEDCPLTSGLLTFLIEHMGAEPTHVSDGRTALERVSSGAFDVVLVDMQLPGMDGFTTARELRDKGFAGYLVGMSARGMPSDPELALDSGCDHFIDKGELKEMLPKVLRPALGGEACPD